MKTVLVESDYAVPAARLWALVTGYAALEEVMQGLISFEGLPEGRTVTGQSFDLRVSLFGKLPWQPYHMDVLECDDAKMVLRSSEKGAGVTHWMHRLSVSETDHGCCLSDKIEIEAGLLTPLFAAWAKYLYSARHAPRLRLLDRPQL